MRNLETYFNSYGEKFGRFENFTFEQPNALLCRVRINYPEPLDICGRLVASETVIDINLKGDVTDFGDKDLVPEDVYGELLNMAREFINTKRVKQNARRSASGN